jgi:hypothetical protein
MMSREGGRKACACTALRALMMMNGLPYSSNASDMAANGAQMWLADDRHNATPRQQRR